MIWPQNERFQDPYFESYTTSDRLPFDKFNDGLIDDKGFMWFSSVHGLVRFDGYEFKVFRNEIGGENELLEARPSKIVLDKNGFLWIAGEKGLTRMNLTTGARDRLSKDLEKYPIIGDRTTKMSLGPEGHVWLNNWAGLSRINVDNLEVTTWDLSNYNKQPHGSTNAATYSWDKKHKDIIWVGSERGLVRLNLKTSATKRFQTPFFVQNKDKLKLEYDYHTFIYADSSGVVYTGRWGKSSGKSRNEGINIFNPETNEWRLIRIEGGRSSSQSIREISYKSPEELWIRTPNNGMGIFNKKEETFQFISYDPDKAGSLKHPSIRSFMIDHNDNIIIGTHNALSISFKQRSIFKYRQVVPKEMPNVKSGFFITDIIEDDQKMYIASYNGGGLMIKDKESSEIEFISLGSEKGIPRDDMHKMLMDHSGKLFLTSREMLKVYDPATKMVSNFKTIHGEELDMTLPLIYDIVEDESHQIWLGTKGDGLIKISAERDSITYYQHDPSNPNSLVSGAQIRGLSIDQEQRIWVTSYEGVSCFNPKTESFTNYSDKMEGDQYLGNLYTYNSVTDTLGRTWISSYTLFCIDERQPEGKKVETVTIEDGLPGSLVRRMRKHPDGTFWLVTDNGLVHFNPYNRDMEVFSSREGISRDQMWDEDFYFDPAGKVRLYSGYGYREYDPSVEASLIPSNLVFSSFNVNGKQFNDLHDINNSDTIRLGYKENFIAFEYALLNYAPKMDNEYAYQLEGLDKDWIDAGDKNYTEYSNLEGGYYTFKVRANDKLGMKGANELHKIIYIATPFWKTTWFKLLLAFCFLGLVYLYYRNRIKGIRKEKLLMARLAENEMIALRAQMNPHFLFNTINSIKRFIIKNETTIAADHLTKFSRLVRLILNNSNSRSIPLKDEIEALKLYIEMEMMRFDDKFDYIIEVDETLDQESIEIPPMLMQPFVENAIWHGLMHKLDGDGLLKVELNGNNGYLECLITDNGVGREKAAEIKSKSAIKKKSLGMSLTQRRIELLDQFSESKIINLEIEDLVDDKDQSVGTKVVIRIPIDQKMNQQNQPK